MPFDRLQLPALLGCYSLALSFLCLWRVWFSHVHQVDIQPLDVLWMLSVTTSTSLFLFMHLLSHLAWKWPPLKWRSCRVEGNGEEISSYTSCNILEDCSIMPSFFVPVAVIWVPSVFYIHPKAGALLGRKIMSCMSRPLFSHRASLEWCRERVRYISY